MFTVEEVRPLFFVIIGMLISNLGELSFALGQLIREKSLYLHKKNEKENK